MNISISFSVRNTSQGNNRHTLSTLSTYVQLISLDFTFILFQSHIFIQVTFDTVSKISMASIYVHAVHTAFELQSDRHRTHTYTHLMFRICGSDNIFSMAISSQSTFSVLLVLARAMFCLILSHSHTCHIHSKLATITTSSISNSFFSP